MKIISTTNTNFRGWVDCTLRDFYINEKTNSAYFHLSFRDYFHTSSIHSFSVEDGVITLNTLGSVYKVADIPEKMLEKAIETLQKNIDDENFMSKIRNVRDLKAKARNKKYTKWLCQLSDGFLDGCVTECITEPMYIDEARNLAQTGTLFSVEGDTVGIILEGIS
jgi:hypothetical protein